MLRLLRLSASKYRLSVPCWCGGTWRELSPPRAGFSILVTVAPRSPNSCEANGPTPYSSMVRTLSPVSGPVMRRAYP